MLLFAGLVSVDDSVLLEGLAGGVSVQSSNPEKFYVSLSLGGLESLAPLKKVLCVSSIASWRD